MPHSITAAAKPRVLVVDDDPLVLRIVYALLNIEFDVLTACTGDDALSRLGNDPGIAVIISDLQMPGVLSGNDLLGRVRREHPDVVRIALTGDKSSATILDAVNRGFVFRYLVKPVVRGELVGAVRDAVEQRRLVSADKALLQGKLDQMSSQLLQAERLATLGGLANGVGHELNNIAAALSMALDELADAQMHEVAPDDELMTQLERVATHVSTHARYLLHLGKPRGDAVETVNLSTVATDVVRMLSQLGRTRGVKVQCEASAVEAPLVANRTRLEQVITNLVINAADAAEGIVDRTVEVVVRVRRCGDRVVLEVSDNASGITPEHLGRIFDPYFTTKGAEKGTGLGLAVVRQIAEAFGGDLQVASTVGVGTTFSIVWPLAVTAGQSAAA